MARILVVDDDTDIVEAIQIVLESKGYELAAAHNKPDGMKAVADFDRDMIILDVMMEEPDEGIAMAQELRAGGFKKSILMLTSVAKVTGMSFDKDGDLVPVNDFSEKPISPENLVSKVQELLKAQEGA